MNAYNQNVTYDADMEVVSMTPAVDPIAFGLQNVKKVVIKDKEMENVAEFNIGAKGIEVKTRQDLFVNVSTAQEPAPQTMQTTKVTAFGVGNTGMKDSQENHKQEQVDETETSFFKPFVKKRKKALRRVGSVPQNIQEYGDGEDESIPFSKKEKQEQRYKEREIEG